MKIELISLHIENIRNLRNLSLDFYKDKPNHLTTIQMPNGTGKTTTLSLLKFLFTGDSLTSEQVVSYRPTAYEAYEGRVILKIKIDNSDFTIELVLNYDEQTFAYTTRSTVIGGYEDGYCIPKEYRLSHDMVELFVFNGEIAANLLRSSSNVAEQSIDCLYGLSKVNDLSECVKKLKQTIRDNSKTKISRSSTLGQKRKKLIELEQCLENIENANLQDKKRIDEIEGELEDIRVEMNQLQNPETRSKLELLQKDIDKSKIDIEVKTSELRNLGINPMTISDYYSNSLFNLRDNMDSLKLPRGTSSEFFEELCESDSCICGAKMTPALKMAIRNNASKYLSDELAGVMNSIKADITTNKDDSTQVQLLLEEIRGIKRKLREDEQEHTKLKNTFGGADSQKRYSELLKQEAILVQERNQCEENIRLSTDVLENPVIESNLTLCKEEIEELRKEIGQGDIIVKKLSQCDVAERLLTEIYQHAMHHLKKRVIDITNETLYPILGDEIIVTNIDRSIKLKNKDEGSEGQVLTTGYAYISALFKDSEFKLPFIIDSPCGSLDLDKRSYVAKKIPSLFEQVVFFVTSSERARFTDVLLKSEDIHPYTIWRDVNNGGTDLIISQDLDYFNNFQIDEVGEGANDF